MAKYSASRVHGSKIGAGFVYAFFHDDKESVHTWLRSDLRRSFPNEYIERKGDKYFINGALVGVVKEVGDGDDDRGCILPLGNRRR